MGLIMFHLYLFDYLMCAKCCRFDIFATIYLFYKY